MRILMAGASPYMPATGGAYKANRILAEGLAARGHSVHVLALARTAIRRSATLDEFFVELSRRGIAPSGGPVYRFCFAGVEVHATDGALTIVDHLKRQIAEQDPDLVLVSSEDWRQLLLTAALDCAPGRVVYLAHTSTALPVGHASAEPHPAGAALLERTAAIITPSHWLASYLAGYTQARIVTCTLPVFGTAPFPHHDTFDRGRITMVNPCAVKGISIFLGLARARPDLQFAAVPTWGATDDDLATLAILPNVEILPASEQIDDIFAATRVLLVPSLWQETFGLLPIEAMLRGIPVIASASAGLVEAMLGLDFSIPIVPIQRYRRRSVMPTAELVPGQDLAPWLHALERLSDRACYRELATRARRAALEFVSHLDLGEIEQLLQSLSTRR